MLFVQTWIWSKGYYALTKYTFKLQIILLASLHHIPFRYFEIALAKYSNMTWYDMINTSVISEGLSYEVFFMWTGVSF